MFGNTSACARDGSERQLARPGCQPIDKTHLLVLFIRWHWAFKGLPATWRAEACLSHAVTTWLLSSGDAQGPARAPAAARPLRRNALRARPRHRALPCPFASHAHAPGHVERQGACLHSASCNRVALARAGFLKVAIGGRSASASEPRLARPGCASHATLACHALPLLSGFAHLKPGREGGRGRPAPSVQLQGNTSCASRATQASSTQASHPHTRLKPTIIVPPPVRVRLAGLQGHSLTHAQRSHAVRVPRTAHRAPRRDVTLRPRPRPPADCAPCRRLPQEPVAAPASLTVPLLPFQEVTPTHDRPIVAPVLQCACSARALHATQVCCLASMPKLLAAMEPSRKPGGEGIRTRAHPPVLGCCAMHGAPKRLHHATVPRVDTLFFVVQLASSSLLCLSVLSSCSCSSSCPCRRWAWAGCCSRSSPRSREVR